MGQGIGLDPDGVCLADELSVGEHGAVDEAQIGQLLAVGLGGMFGCIQLFLQLPGFPA